MKTKGKSAIRPACGTRQGGNQAVLERLDAALAENTGSKLSAREKIDRLQRRLFGDAAVDALNASEARVRAGRAMVSDEPKTVEGPAEQCSALR